MRILSQPGQNDGLIRGWLAWEGSRWPCEVLDGVIWTRSDSHAERIRRRLDRTWGEWGCGAPMPTVDWPREEV
jgi:hypothetical protein